MYVGLKTAVVTSAAKIVGSAPQHFWGYTCNLRNHSAMKGSEKFLVISDSSAGTTGTDIKISATLRGGTSVESGFINGFLPHPCKITNGLRCQLIGWRNGGCTVVVYYAG